MSDHKISFALVFMIVSCSGGATDVTYHQDVAPIFAARCESCHTEGGIGPFVIDNFEDAKEWAHGIVQATQSRAMPPQAVIADGSCGEWKNAEWLSDAELDAIKAWVDGGTLAGDADDAAPRTPGFETASVAQLDPNAPSYALEQPYVPQAHGSATQKFEDYHCFLVDLDLDRDQFITGYEVMPDNEAIVHHMIGFLVDPDMVVTLDPEGNPVTNGDMMALHDSADPDSGWKCGPLAGEGVIARTVPMAWAPGVNVMRYPEGTGLYMSKNEVLVLQIHYNLVNGTGPDQSGVRLEFADQVERPANLTLSDGFLPTAFTDDPMLIEPGLARAPISWQMSVDEYLDVLEERLMTTIPYVDVYGFAPHMHERGVTFRTRLLGDAPSDEQCLTSIEDWDFDWQFTYWRKDPVRLQRGLGHKVEVECEFDTRDTLEPVMPGLGTQTEMCLIGMYSVLPEGSQIMSDSMPDSHSDRADNDEDFPFGR